MQVPVKPEQYVRTERTAQLQGKNHTYITAIMNLYNRIHVVSLLIYARPTQQGQCAVGLVCCRNMTAAHNGAYISMYHLHMITIIK